uniref:hypothetical protein n=1 Tax=Flavobacterium sp. Root935 TaxID=1736610 RepID=UPI000FF8ACC7|nr:hypothetical protein [Flavobacterium sp. Root935]
MRPIIVVSQMNGASIGFRHFGKFKGLKYNNEMAYQFGTFGHQDISAWTLSFNVEKNRFLWREP